jgi:hypothetical protein
MGRRSGPWRSSSSDLLCLSHAGAPGVNGHQYWMLIALYRVGQKPPVVTLKLSSFFAAAMTGISRLNRKDTDAARNCSHANKGLPPYAPIVPFGMKGSRLASPGQSFAQRGPLAFCGLTTNLWRILPTKNVTFHFTYMQIVVFLSLA